MNNNLVKILAGVAFVVMTGSFMPSGNEFTAAEQQQVSIATPGLFARSNVFNVDFSQYKSSEYSFPLPVGKASVTGNNRLKIKTKKGDAVKAMFHGVVRLSRKLGNYGNVIVIRHDNGLETVYANNAENLVKVGQHVDAGQTVAIVGEKDGEVYCDFLLMVNGGRINPTTILDVEKHRLRKKTIQCRKRNNYVSVTVINSQNEEKKELAEKKKAEKKREEIRETRHRNGVATTLDPNEASDPFLNSATFELDLEGIEKEHWAYPLAGSHVISPYGGRRNHGGVDIKTRPNDKIVAAFDGVVTRSCPYYGYGNCIVIRHAYGFETLYSHQSRNFVKKGQHVKAGQVIGLTGRTGRATTEHLHFEVHFKGRRMNPAVLFNHANKCLQRSTLTLHKNGRVVSTRHMGAKE